MARRVAKKNMIHFPVASPCRASQFYSQNTVQDIINATTLTSPFINTVTKSIYRDPPEPTGDEPEDFEFEAPKIYEPVSS